MWKIKTFSTGVSKIHSHKALYQLIFVIAKLMKIKPKKLAQSLKDADKYAKEFHEELGKLETELVEKLTKNLNK